MKRTLLFFVFSGIALTSCSLIGGGSSGGRTTKVVKPRYHHTWFDRKKDKRVKRTRVVKMRI